MTAPQTVTVSGRRRAFVVVSLIAAAVLVVAFLVFLFRNGGHLLVALLGLAIAAAGAWWLITERGVKRAIGLVGVLVGAVVMTVFIGKTVSTVDKPVLRLLAVVVLLAIAAGAARLSLAREAHEIERDHPHHGTVPKHPVLICNPWSGGGKVEKFGLVELAAELGIETVMLDQGPRPRAARPRRDRPRRRLPRHGRRRRLAGAGGVDRGRARHPVRVRHRGHAQPLRARPRPRPRRPAQRACTPSATPSSADIDYATVNGRFFVNNVSLGVYATIVQQEGYRDAKVDTTEPLLPELLGQTEQALRPPVHRARWQRGRRRLPDPGLEQPVRARGLARHQPSAGASTPAKLGVFAVTAATGAEAAKLVTLSAIGQRNLSPNWHEFTTDVFEVRSRSGKAYAGVDGEALEMSTPLRCEIHPGGLRLYVPEGNLAVAEQRRARDISVSSVVAVARGVEPADA